MCNHWWGLTESETVEDTKESEHSKESAPLPEPPIIQETSLFTVAYTGAARMCEIKGTAHYFHRPSPTACCHV